MKPNDAVPDDRTILEDVTSALDGCQELAYANISARVSSGCVTLTGDADDAHQRHTALALALHVPGVVAVLNEVTIPVHRTA